MILSQGDLIRLDFSPSEGHEQAGYRPALVVSKTIFNRRTGQAVVCPITSRQKPYPTRIPLVRGGKIYGYVICEQLKTIDVDARNPKCIERIDPETLKQVIDMIRMIF